MQIQERNVFGFYIKYTLEPVGESSFDSVNDVSVNILLNEIGEMAIKIQRYM